MKLRSLLFVPGDRPDRFAKAAASGADAIILDLEDSVLPGQKPAAREAVTEYLCSKPSITVMVRINPVNSSDCDLDLDAILECAPAGIVLPKAEGAGSVTTLVGKEYAEDIPVLPIATETPAAIFELGSYRKVGTHLLGLTWGAEDLPAAIGASTAREADGSYTAPYQLARSLTLFAAHAAGVPAIETVFPDFRDSAGLTAYATRARRDGFTGMMAIHPAQIPVINEAFAPSAEEIAQALAIIAAFENDPKAGVLNLDGQMIDRPHLSLARRIIEQSND